MATKTIDVDYERSNTLNAAEAILENAQALQERRLGRPRTDKILMELEHDLEDALKSVRAIREQSR